jgi:hypothetical protein
MSKHSADNRSNQLNPNNDAYYSSRSGSGHDDDDCVGAGRVMSVESRLHEAFAPYYQENARLASIQRERFEFDFVSLGGQIALLEFTAVLEKPSHKYCDCQDVAEHVFQRVDVSICSIFETPLAFSQIRRGGNPSRLVCNYGYHYSPSLKSVFPSESETARREMWFATGEMAVERLKLLVQKGEETPRENLGEITPEMLRAKFWKV